MLQIDFPTTTLPPRYLKIYEHLNKLGILLDFNERFTFPDEPQFYQYACERISGLDKHKTSHGFGCSESQKEAFKIAIAEAIEHYCILYEQKDKFIRTTFQEFGDKATDPIRFTPFSKQQLMKDDYQQFRVSHKTSLNWIKAHSLTRNKSVFVPAGAVYASYHAQGYGEPVFQPPNNTGSALGETIEFALYRGICEIVERDHYMISFLNNIPKKLIDVSNDSLSELDYRIRRYALEPYYLLTQLDTPVVTVACILIDRTGSGPAVCTGLGGDMDPRHAVQTAAFEAVRRHISARDRFFRNEPLPMPEKFSFDWFLLEKQRRWAHPAFIDIASQFLSGDKVFIGDLQKPTFGTYKSRVSRLVKDLDLLGCEVIYVDVTTPEVKKEGLTVVKVLIPEMVPLCRDERYPYLGYDRFTKLPPKYGIAPRLTEDMFKNFTIHPF